MTWAGWAEPAQLGLNEFRYLNPTPIRICIEHLNQTNQNPNWRVKILSLAQVGYMKHMLNVITSTTSILLQKLLTRLIVV